MGGFVSRGFKGRRRPAEQATRLPPGQYAERGFPVLSAGPTPRVDLADWRLKVEGLVARPQEWTWKEAQALPASSFEGDIHCVTRWSKLGTSFGGVSVDTLLEAAEPLPEASHLALFQKYRWGTSSRAGPPCSAGRGAPSCSHTTHALPPLRSSRGRLVV